MAEKNVIQVRKRLLDAAEKLFCEMGYEETSVRDLTALAQCNVAAVNYHFGGKDKLYIEMFRKYIKTFIEIQIENIKKVMSSENPTPEDLIKAVAQKYLASLDENNDEMPLLKLYVREILNPHLSQEIIAHEVYADIEELFVDSIVKLIPDLDVKDAAFCKFCIKGVMTNTLLFYEFLSESHPDIKFDELIEHIVKFTCAGVRSFAEK